MSSVCGGDRGGAPSPAASSHSGEGGMLWRDTSGGAASATLKACSSDSSFTSCYSGDPLAAAAAAAAGDAFRPRRDAGNSSSFENWMRAAAAGAAAGGDGGGAGGGGDGDGDRGDCDAGPGGDAPRRRIPRSISEPIGTALARQKLAEALAAAPLLAAAQLRRAAAPSPELGPPPSPAPPSPQAPRSPPPAGDAAAGRPQRPSISLHRASFTVGGASARPSLASLVSFHHHTSAEGFATAASALSSWSHTSGERDTTNSLEEALRITAAPGCARARARPPAAAAAAASARAR